MSTFFFMILLILTGFIRIPLAFLAIVLRNLHPKIKERIDFERKNFTDPYARSFKRDNLRADYCFEVSSEGELEQIRPLLMSYLGEKKRIELIYASASVEEKCHKLVSQYPELLRALRMPLVSFFPFNFLYFQSVWQWMSAPVLIFCRYDFFPELLLFKLWPKKFILLSGAGKNLTWFKKRVYQLFDVIVAASRKEEQIFKALVHCPVFTFDFRIPRIFERLALKEKTLAERPALKPYLQYLASLERKNLLIMGSAWESDFAILDHPELKKELALNSLHLLIVPHSLKSEHIEAMKKKLQNETTVPVFEINAKENFDPQLLLKNGGVVVLNLSGVLCELYTYFDLSYVGGGYERSIHSCLEPFLAGSQVFCGEKVHRSVEFDYLSDVCPDEIHLLKNPGVFYNEFCAVRNRRPDQALREKLKTESRQIMASIMNEIE